MRPRFAGLTDVGLQREHNEDAFLLMEDYRLAVVADGMGGHRSGDVASRLATVSLEEFFSKTVSRQSAWPFPFDAKLTNEENGLATAIRWANRRIHERSESSERDSGMGTTVVTALFTQDSSVVTIGHVGDSRAYRVRRGEIAQLTRDHSLISDATQLAPWLTPEEVAQIPSNVITRALGIRQDCVVDLLTEQTQPNDVYLLCSDGLTTMVSDDQLLEIIGAIDDLDEACAALVERANFYGGADNITVVLIRVEEGVPPKHSKSVMPPRGPNDDEETVADG